MKMPLSINPFILLVLSFFITSSAMAGFKNVQVSGGFSFPNMDHTNRNPYNNSQVFGNTNGNNHSNVGVETFWQFGEHKRGLELGVKLVEFGANLKTGTATQTRQYYEKTPFLAVNINHKWLVHENINLGAGAYVAMPFGKTIREGQLSAAGGTVSNFYQELDTSSTYKTLDYGLVADIEGTLPFDEHWYGLAQFQYFYSLVNLNTAGTGTITQYSALLNIGVGYKF